MDIPSERLPCVSTYAETRKQRTAEDAGQPSAFAKYLDADRQRQKMRELPPGRTLPSVYLQFKEDYQAWKARQPQMTLPESRGWTEENLAFLREHCIGENLSACEVYDALETMEDMGMLSQRAKNCAVGMTWIRVNLSDSGVFEQKADLDSKAAWLHGFEDAPMVGFHSLDDILAWAKDFREEDYQEFITHAEAMARGWV